MNNNSQMRFELCTICFSVFGICMPETPIFLLSKGKIKEAENALVKLRKKKPVEVQDEINEILIAVEKDNQGQGIHPVNFLIE